jgi:hypothetical protein
VYLYFIVPNSAVQMQGQACCRTYCKCQDLITASPDGATMFFVLDRAQLCRADAVSEMLSHFETSVISKPWR